MTLTLDSGLNLGLPAAEAVAKGHGFDLRIVWTENLSISGSWRMADCEAMVASEPESPLRFTPSLGMPG